MYLRRFNRIYLNASRRSIFTSSMRYDDSLEDPGPPIKRPKKYLDLKTFRNFLKQQKTLDIETEKRNIAKTYAKKPPHGWGVLEFLKAIGIDEGAESIAGSFTSWNEFISSTSEELYSNTTMTNKQRRIIIKHITLYNHGLWPKTDDLDYLKLFQAPPLKNEGKPWDEEADKELLRLAEYYDVNFGDPWLYISWDMQRTIEDVQERYTQIAIIPKNREDRCELAITKSHRPLLMNRKFKLDPAFVYIIPSEENFPLSDIYVSEEDRTKVKAEDVFSEKFKKYRTNVFN